jgi:hypothetical protein
VAGGESDADWEAFYLGFVEAFGPVGVPEEETVREMAITKWRLRRVIRAETADINARFDAIDDPASYPAPEPEHPFIELGLSDLPRFEPDPAWFDVERGVAVLEALSSTETPVELIDPDWESALELTERIMSPGDEELPELWTKASFIEFLTKTAASMGYTFSGWVTETLDGIPAYLDSRERQAAAEQAKAERAAAARERRRRYLERAAILASPEMDDRFRRAEAHLDRRFAKLLSQLELLQRMRSGQDVPPPMRIEIHDHTPDEGD